MLRDTIRPLVRRPQADSRHRAVQCDAGGSRATVLENCCSGRVSLWGTPSQCPTSKRLYIATEKPPSTGMAVPVTKSDAGLARNAATPAMSGGVPQRPMGVRFSTLSCRP